MADGEDPAALVASEVPPRLRQSNYPPELAKRVAGREKRALGDAFGLGVFGVNLTRLAPGAESALLHRHMRQDEFVYVLEGTPTLVKDGTETLLRPGMCAGFRAGGAAHHLINRTDQVVVILEVGDRTGGDEVFYPADDLQVTTTADGGRIMTRKDGSPFV